MFKRLASALLMLLVLTTAAEARGDALVVVSYYSQPGITANGERFNPHKFTVANKHLPFNTIVKFTNPKNHKYIYARVNDRGPWIRGREYDLSVHCAAKLGILKEGVARLRAEVVR